MEVELSETIRGFLSEIVTNLDNHLVNSTHGNKNGLMSDVLFLTLTHKKTNEKLQLVIKQSVPIPGIGELCFENEISFYQSVWPKLTAFWNHKVGKPLPEFIARCYVTSKNPYALVLGDVTSEGFAVHPKTKPFTDELCRLIFDRYGVFHAMSLILKKHDPERFRKLVEPLRGGFEHAFDEKRFFGRYMKEYIKEIAMEFESKNYAKLLKKMEKYVLNGHELVGNALKYDTDNCVVLHGDCWSNNILFKYDVSILKQTNL